MVGDWAKDSILIPASSSSVAATILNCFIVFGFKGLKNE
jgi:hypothetical protein